MTIRLGEATYGLHGEMGWDDRFRGLLSTRYAASVVLHDRGCWLEQFEPERIADSGLGLFASERISVRTDPQLPVNGAAIEVELFDGRRLSVRREAPKGDADDPLSIDELTGKFRAAARGVIGERECEAALEMLLGIEGLANVDRLMRSLRGAAVAVA
jgi:2-methylcitrate dehydratase PrpD